jgi:cytochrome c peroxidase
LLLVVACGDDEPTARDAGGSGSGHDHDGHVHMPFEPVPDASYERDSGRPDSGNSEQDSGAESDAAAPDPFVWPLPAWLPTPVVPDDNPMSDAKVELGRHLFYDTRLSENETQSCASCHVQALAFTDGRALAVGSTGEAHPRNSMALGNIAYAASLTWANPALLQLEHQAIVPIFGDRPVELGLRGKEELLVERLRAEARYAALFPRVYPDDADPFTVGNVTRALSAFQRVMISANAPYDRYVYGGDDDAISDAAKRGGDLFNSEKLECFHCHNGFNFQDSINYVGKGALELRFHNTGLYNIGGTGAYPSPNTGVHELTQKPEDMGRFRVPSLRNIALTAPYMHDGSIATLDEVIDHYAAAGRTIASGPNAGDGSANPFKSDLIIGFTISAEERADLIAFLESLTDEAFVTDPKLSDPWSAPCSLCSSSE